MKLFEARDYRDFLNRALALREETTKKRTNFSALTRAAGFTSRSFIREVLSGQKGLSQGSLVKLKKAFGLSGAAGRYFECLVAREEAGIEIGLKTTVDIEAEMTRVRAQAERRAQNSLRAERDTRWAFHLQDLGEVYAGLGDAGGASISEIQQRTRLPASKIEAVLKYLLQQNVITRSDDKYLVTDSTVDLFELGRDQDFCVYFAHAAAKLQRRSQAACDSTEELFFHSALSVRRSRLPALKKQLRALLMEFLDEAQDDSGDRVAKLTVGFHL